MKFYNRKEELGALEQSRLPSVKSGCVTGRLGRRRIGKSALILEALKKQKHLYLFVTRQSEALLCARFQEEAAKALGLKIFGELGRFRDLLEQLLVWAETNPYTLVIDEFQELERVNPAIFSEIQELWDRYKGKAKIHLIACGSIYSMMLKIFEHGKEPLFGRMTSKITLRPFKISVVKKILKDHKPAYTPEDLLCFYMLSGGVPKYIELLMDWGACSFEQMLERAIRPDSPFLGEGRELLVGEFGRTGLLLSLIKKNYEQYSGLVLEDYFRTKIAEETDAAAVGVYWDKRGENEIDCIALNDSAKTALVAEVKRKAGKIDLSVLRAKATSIEKELAAYKTAYRGFSMEDM
jgi:AAA+ ATPase superfamily predicted ATPase